jgi:hypothetical protein
VTLVATARIAVRVMLVERESLPPAGGA